MKKRFEKLIDVKSIITIMLIAVLTIAVLGDFTADERVFNLFSNVTTMVITYFFTRKSDGKEASHD